MEIEKLFYYPVGISSLDKDESFFNELESLIYKEKERSKGVKISNFGGWQSNKELFENKSGRILEFTESLKEKYCEFLSQIYAGQQFSPKDIDLECWANINFNGNSNNSHDHTVNDNHWSGILYLNPGEIGGSNSSGKTVFEDRNLSGDGRTIGSIPFHKEYKDRIGEASFLPEKGKLVFFPGTLWHRVDEYTGETPRITIAFNLRVRSLETFSFDQGSKGARFMNYMWTNYRGLMVMGSRIKRTFVK